MLRGAYCAFHICGASRLPRQYPIRIIELAVVFFVCPVLVEVHHAKAKTKDGAPLIWKM